MLTQSRLKHVGKRPAGFSGKMNARALVKWLAEQRKAWQSAGVRA